MTIQYEGKKKGGNFRWMNEWMELPSTYHSFLLFFPSKKKKGLGGGAKLKKRREKRIPTLPPSYFG